MNNRQASRGWRVEVLGMLCVAAVLGCGTEQPQPAENKTVPEKVSEQVPAKQPAAVTDPSESKSPEVAESTPPGEPVAAEPGKQADSPEPVPPFVTRSQNIALHLELQSLSAALINVQLEHGVAPDFTNEDQLRAYLKSRWPMIAEDEVDKIVALKLNLAQALVFWLQGFTSDAEHPWSGPGERETLYDFDKRRLRGEPAVYVQQHGPQSPIVYFSSASYATAAYEGKHPYQDDQGGYVKPESFQLLCAGLDGDFGSTEPDVFYPSGKGYAAGDRDNITNFSKLGTLADDLP